MILRKANFQTEKKKTTGGETGIHIVSFKATNNNYIGHSSPPLLSMLLYFLLLTMEAVLQVNLCFLIYLIPFTENCFFHVCGMKYIFIYESRVPSNDKPLLCRVFGTRASLKRIFSAPVPSATVMCTHSILFWFVSRLFRMLVERYLVLPPPCCHCSVTIAFYLLCLSPT